MDLPQVLALFEKAPSTEARRNLFCVIFDATIAKKIEVRQCWLISVPVLCCGITRCRCIGL